MKILGIDSFDYSLPSGEERRGYNFYYVSKDASIAGVVVRAVIVSERVLNNALKDFGVSTATQLVGREAEIFYNYDRVKHISRCYFIKPISKK